METMLINKDVKTRLKGASRAFGVSEKEIMDRALILYLDTVKRTVDLKREFDSWDLLTDEGLRKFEAINLE